MTRRLPVVLAAGLLLAACGSGPTEPTVAPSTSTTAAATSGSAVLAADAPEALQFSASRVGGGDIELTTLAGRPVLLWFWAPW